MIKNLKFKTSGCVACIIYAMWILSLCYRVSIENGKTETEALIMITVFAPLLVFLFVWIFFGMDIVRRVP